MSATRTRQSRPARRRRRQRRRWSARTRRNVEQVAGAAAAVVSAAVGLSVLAGVLSGGAWPWVVATYLRWPQVIVAVVATAVLFATRWLRSAALSLMVAVALVFSVVAPLDALTTTVPPGETLRIAVFNTGARNGDIAAISAAVRSASPDVVVMLESEDIAGRVARRIDDLSLLPAAGDGARSAPVVLARREWPVTIAPLGDARPAAVVTAEVGGRPVDVVAAHPLPPVTPEWARSHDRSIAALTGEVLPREHPYVLACDCNTTPWTPSMARLLDAGLRAPTVAATFGAPVVGVPTDHVLLGDGVVAASRELGPFAGSDHRLIVTEVTLKS
ncbi:MAG TPA: endonuclease/exonuclease/phosphatase family protein [Euzebyales bacterium]|nr:endonuclease/exonuclease/phosphatase family protein [Euzebyales bacterium]